MPPTVLRDGPFGPGSVQLFVSFDPDEHFFTLGGRTRTTFRRVAMFDLAANNADRKGGHCLLAADGAIWVIDHGVCFAVEPKLRTVIWTFVDEPLPSDAVADLERVRGELETGGAVADALGALLAPDESAAIAERIDRLAHGGALPGARARRPTVPMAADLTLRHAQVPTPFGPFTVVVSADGVVATSGEDPRELVDELARRVGVVSRAAALRAAARDLEAYFGGRRAPMRTPVDLRLVGTPFARAVLEVTCTIPYAELWTYGDVAARAGRPGAARAAGSALARSPIELFVPCHRVVPAGPGLGAYGGSEDRRATLLRFEGAI